jgi:hypothetical protein
VHSFFVLIQEQVHSSLNYGLYKDVYKPKYCRDEQAYYWGGLCTGLPLPVLI